MKKLVVIAGAVAIVAVAAIVFVVLPSGDSKKRTPANHLNAINGSAQPSVFGLELNGTEVAGLREVSIGGPYADVTSQGTGTAIDKRPGPVKASIIVLKVNTNISKPLTDWIAQSINGVAPKMNGAIVGFNSATPVSRMEFSGGVITGIEVPAADAEGKDPVSFKLTITADHEQVAAPSGQSPQPNGAAVAMVGNFRFSMIGLDASHVTRVDSLAFSPAPTGPTGTEAKQSGVPVKPGNAVSSGDLANFKVTLDNGSTLVGWQTWFNDFVIAGNNGNAQEKTGRIDFLASDLTTVIAHADLGGCGITQLEPLLNPGSTDIGRTAAHMYCQTFQLSLP